MQKVQERSTKIETELLVLHARVGQAPRRQADDLLAHSKDWIVLVITFDLLVATATTCSANRRRRSSARRIVTGASAFDRLFGELISGLEIDIDGETVGLEKGLSHLSDPDREVRKRSCGGGHRGTQARSQNPCLHPQHTAPRQGRQRSAARLPPLAPKSQPVERGVRRIGRGAGHRGPQSLRHPQALVRAQDEDDGRRSTSRTTTGRHRWRPTTDRSNGATQRHRARIVRVVLCMSSPVWCSSSTTRVGSTLRPLPARARVRSAATRCPPAIPT